MEPGDHVETLHVTSLHSGFGKEHLCLSDISHHQAEYHYDGGFQDNPATA